MQQKAAMEGDETPVPEAWSTVRVPMSYDPEKPMQQSTEPLVRLQVSFFSAAYKQ
jgi:hypothetical protein